MDLFEHGAAASSENKPLAESLRPKNFDELLGIENIQGFAGPFQSLVENGHLQNLILWGPPGTGKTTFARLLTSKVSAEFLALNAVSSGAKELRLIGEESKRRLIEHQRKTVVFVDEIHRFNKSQQDVLLPYMESGHFVLVGATTENPSYELNAALLSRSRLLVFHHLPIHQMSQMVERACQFFNFTKNEILQPEAEAHIVQLADGDARRLCNIMEPILLLKATLTDESWPVGVEQVERLSGQKASYFDKKGDLHYDTVSAFIKSIRGSDADAGLYYLARMLEGGEDPVFIARRLVILASEDVGNADPKALSLAVAGLQAVELVGLPEAAINLAQVVTYMASAPKSNRSYLGLRRAQSEVHHSGNLPVPLALRSAKGKEMKALGYGRDYRYSHNGERGYVAQRFLPEGVRETSFYQPSEHGFEKSIRQYAEWMKQEKIKDEES